MDYCPYCLYYIKFDRENDFKPIQSKKFRRNVSKEILQSFFKEFAEHERLVSTQNPIKFGRRMIELFREHEIYQRKTPEERQEIEDFLRFHPEIIEITYNAIDRDSFEITDDFEVLDIKANASDEVIYTYYFHMINNHYLFKDNKGNYDNIIEYVIEDFKHTTAYKSRSEEEKLKMLENFKTTFIEEVEDFKKLCCMWWIDDLFEIQKAFFKKIVRLEKPNIFVLHSLNGDTLEMWGKQVKAEFENQTNVIMPKFPIRAESSFEKFDEIMKDYYLKGMLNSNSIVVCHSIGNPYFIRFCAEHKYIPVPRAYIAVAPGAVYEYPSSRNDYIVEVKKQAYLKPEELVYVKNNFESVVCFYSDEDDGNKEKFERFIADTGAEGVYLEGYNHFDGYHNIQKVPEIIEKIKEFMSNKN